LSDAAFKLSDLSACRRKIKDVISNTVAVGEFTNALNAIFLRDLDTSLSHRFKVIAIAHAAYLQIFNKQFLNSQTFALFVKNTVDKRTSRDSARIISAF